MVRSSNGRTLPFQGKDMSSILIRTTKICSVCKKRKKLELFNINNSKKDGLQSHCKKCSRSRSRAFYKSNNKRQLKLARARKIVHIKNDYIKLIKYFKTHPCVDCNEIDPMVLECDHLYDKKYNISMMVSDGMSWSKIEQELSKCQVRCANCHRRVTAKRANTWRWKLRNI